MTHTSTGRRLAIIATTLAAIALVASVPLATANDAPTPAGWVSQIGTFDYLVQPDYDGLAPVRDGVRGATIGLGTFDRLDGELVLIGGTTYRVGIDGIPRVVSTSRTTPWVEAVRFTPQASMRVPAGTECSALAPLTWWRP